MVDNRIAEIKKEANYYLGHEIGEQEAEEISWLWEEHPYADLSEIVEQYYKGE